MVRTKDFGTNNTSLTTNQLLGIAKNSYVQGNEAASPGGWSFPMNNGAMKKSIKKNESVAGGFSATRQMQQKCNTSQFSISSLAKKLDIRVPSYRCGIFNPKRLSLSSSSSSFPPPPFYYLAVKKCAWSWLGTNKFWQALAKQASN